MLPAGVVWWAVPPTLVVVAVWGRWRGATWPEVLAREAVALSVLWIVAQTMFPLATDAEIWRQAWRFRDPQLVPLRTIRHDLVGLTSERAAAEQLVGNVLLFIPLGFTLPVATERARRFGTVVAIGALLSVAIELTQTLVPMHTPDVDDVLLNTLGTAIGFGIYAVSDGIRRRALSV